jgi:hypothetical protein
MLVIIGLLSRVGWGNMSTVSYKCPTLPRYRNEVILKAVLDSHIVFAQNIEEYYCKSIENIYLFTFICSPPGCSNYPGPWVI